MIIVRLNTATRIPVRVLDVSGNPLTGITPASFLSGNVTVVSPSGSTADIAGSNGVNWFEINATKAPGLYHFLVPALNVNAVGPTQLSIQPSAPGAFLGLVSSFLVESYAADLATASTQAANAAAYSLIVRKIQTNHWKVFNNQLVVYDDDKTTPLYTFNLFDDTGTPTQSKIFERTPV